MIVIIGAHPETLEWFDRKIAQKQLHGCGITKMYSILYNTTIIAVSNSKF